MAIFCNFLQGYLPAIVYEYSNIAKYRDTRPWDIQANSGGGNPGGVDAHRLSITRNQHESNHLNKDKHRCPQVIKNTWINPTWISMIFLLSHMDLSENMVYSQL
jgi:hypothetical protein